MDDSRVSHLLKSVGLENYAWKDGDVKAVLSRLDSIEFTQSESWRLTEMKRSVEYIKNNLS